MKEQRERGNRELDKRRERLKRDEEEVCTSLFYLLLIITKLLIHDN